MQEVLIYFFIFIAINLIAVVVYFIFNIIRCIRFNKRFMARKQATTIPSIVYYSGKLLVFVCKAFLSVLFFPVHLLLIRPLRKGRRAHTSACFRKHTPYENSKLTNSIELMVHPNNIKKLRFRCPFWDSFNNGEYFSYYDCIHSCPLFHEGYPHFLYTDAEERKYNSFNENEFKTDLSDYK